MSKKKASQEAEQENPSPETESNQDPSASVDASTVATGDAEPEKEQQFQSLKELAAEAPASPKPSLGRIVHYCLSEQDAQLIERDLKIGHVNCLQPGDLVAGIVVRTFGEGSLCNLRLMMDGECRREPWVTSRAEGTEPGTWRWPARV